MNIPEDMKPNTTHETNSCGTLKILKYNGKYSVIVRFENTKNIMEVASSNIR